MLEMYYLRTKLTQTTMKHISFCLFFLVAAITMNAQNQDAVKKYFDKCLDELVADSRLSAKDNKYTRADEEERTDPTYFRMFTPTVLYESTIKQGFNDGFDLTKQGDSEIELYEHRQMMIDRLLLNVYKLRPDMVNITEADMRSLVTPAELEEKQRALLDEKKDKPLVIPDNVQGNLETKVVKPNYWRTSGSFSFSFTQNYFSGNWAQGGDNNKTLITILKLHLNYNDKKKISFENTFEAKLGFVTVSGDTLHNYKTNNDMLRLDSKFGYKILNNVNLSAKMTLQTQSMPNYPTNTRDFVSNFMAPFDANFSVGLDYKRSGKNWNLSVYFAPLSAYNYKFVRYGYLASRYGIRVGRQHKEDFGTQIQPTFNATICKNVTLNSRMEYYTNYSRAYFNWENTFKMKINKYLDATLFMHGRFDDSSRGLYSDSYGYWQFKEYMTLGLTYSW